MSDCDSDSEDVSLLFSLFHSHRKKHKTASLAARNPNPIYEDICLYNTLTLPPRELTQNSAYGAMRALEESESDSNGNPQESAYSTVMDNHETVPSKQGSTYGNVDISKIKMDN